MFGCQQYQKILSDFFDFSFLMYIFINQLAEKSNSSVLEDLAYFSTAFKNLYMLLLIFSPCEKHLITCVLSLFIFAKGTSALPVYTSNFLYVENR